MNTKLNGKSDTHSHPYLNTANVANNLTTTSAGYALDARQGKALNDAVAGKASIGGEPNFNGVSLGPTKWPYIYYGGPDNKDIMFRYDHQSTRNTEFMSMTRIHDAVNKSHNAPKLRVVTVSDVADEAMNEPDKFFCFTHYGSYSGNDILDAVRSLQSSGYTVLGGFFIRGPLNDEHFLNNTSGWDGFVCSVTNYANCPYQWCYVSRAYQTLRWEIGILYY